MRNLNKVYILAFLVVGIILVFSTCKKDETCQAIIKVKFQRDSLKPVPEAKVYIGKMINNRGFIDSGYTSTTSEFIYEKDLEAILDVEVMLDTNYVKERKFNKIHYYGKDVLRLRKGKTVNLTIYLDTLNIPY